MGWGGIITFMFPCTHRHSNLIIFLGGVGWGGVGDNNVHVPVHPQAQQPHHLSCCPADTGSDGGVGWGGVGWDNNVHVPVHPQAQQPHHLSCCPAGTGSDLSR